MIIAYWAVVLMTGITLVTAILTRIQVDTRRKVFHGMVVIMFLIPGTLDPPFTYLCLSLALAAFLLLDAVRAGQLPPFSGKIAVFLEPFVDGRDLKGPVVVSHVFLLLGCAVGWWLTLAASSNTEEGDVWDWSERRVELAFVSGVVCVGLGDAAASLIGRRYGKTKWGWRGGKSLEGSLAFAIAVMTGLSVGRWWIGKNTDLHAWSFSVWAKIAAVGVWGSMVEAVVTGVNDNIVVPVGAWIMVRGLGL
jgi:dolichol kinase